MPISGGQLKKFYERVVFWDTNLNSNFGDDHIFCGLCDLLQWRAWLNLTDYGLKSFEWKYVSSKLFLEDHGSELRILVWILVLLFRRRDGDSLSHLRRIIFSLSGYWSGWISNLANTNVIDMVEAERWCLDMTISTNVIKKQGPLAPRTECRLLLRICTIPRCMLACVKLHMWKMGLFVLAPIGRIRTLGVQ